MEYTAVIRTLGQAGEKYQKTLDSIVSQTIPPNAIIVYLAEGYDRPAETVGVESIVYVKKGMVAQRALTYDEVETPYILFLDDDVYLPCNAVATLYKELIEHEAQVISPCTFHNHKVPFASKVRLSLLGREVFRPFGNNWAYKVMSNGGFSYLNNPKKGVYWSQSNAGPCLFCRKDDFLRVNLAEELWVEKAPYAFPEDQVLFYKMYCYGLRVLTSFDSGIVHLDASSTVTDLTEKTRKVVYSEYRNKLIFWHRFLYSPSRNLLDRLWKILALAYTYGIQVLKYAVFSLLGKKEIASAFFNGVKDARQYLASDEYRSLSPIPSRK